MVFGSLAPVGRYKITGSEVTDILILILKRRERERGRERGRGRERKQELKSGILPFIAALPSAVLACAGVQAGTGGVVVTRAVLYRWSQTT